QEQSPQAAAGSRDTERQSDIKAIHAQLEAYFANNGRYPTLDMMNDKAFKELNFKGLDEAALQDPNGASSTLVSIPVKDAYSYAVTAAGGGACDNQTTDCMA